MKSSIIIIFISFLLLACQPESESTSLNNTDVANSIPVKVEKVLPLTETRPIISSGIIGSQEEIKLGFKIGGVISAVYVEEGDQVKKGQILARLDPTEINAQVSQAKAALTKSDRDLTRVMALYEDTVATLEQVQNLRTAKEVAEANLQIATFNQRHATIYASSNGRVLKRFSDKGEVIGPGSPVFYLAGSQTTQVMRMGLSDVEVVKVNLGDKATVSIDAWPGALFKGKVSEIAAGSDPRTGMFEIEIQLTNRPKPLKNGFIGKVELIPSLRTEQVRIPISAVIEADQEKVMVYIPGAEEGSFESRELYHYSLEDDYVSVPRTEAKGIELVITDGARYMKSDQAINIINLSPSDQAITVNK